MTALVLDHHHGLICLVLGANLKVAQGHVTGLIECHHTIVLLVLVVAITASGVVVVIDLHIALTALTLNGEGVGGSHALDVGDAYLLVVGTGLDLEHHGAIHAQCTEVVDGALNGGIVGILAHGVGAALAAGHGDGGGGGRLVNRHYGSVDGDRLERGLSRVTHLGITLDVGHDPEVVGAFFLDDHAVGEGSGGREGGGGPRLIDAQGAGSRLIV